MSQSTKTNKFKFQRTVERWLQTEPNNQMVGFPSKRRVEMRWICWDIFAKQAFECERDWIGPKPKFWENAHTAEIPDDKAVEDEQTSSCSTQKPTLYRYTQKQRDHDQILEESPFKDRKICLSMPPHSLIREGVANENHWLMWQTKTIKRGLVYKSVSQFYTR